MKLYKFQEGGAMPVEDPAMAGAPVEEAPVEGQDPMQMLVEGAMEAVQTNNAELALQVCGGLVELVQQSMGGAGEAEPAGEPVFRKGGVLAYRKGGCAKKAKKCQSGAKMGMGQQNNGPKSLPNKGNTKGKDDAPKSLQNKSNIKLSK